jgi:hypothetical protein
VDAKFAELEKRLTFRMDKIEARVTVLEMHNKITTAKTGSLPFQNLPHASPSSTKLTLSTSASPSDAAGILREAVNNGEALAGAKPGGNFRVFGTGVAAAAQSVLKESGGGVADSTHGVLRNTGVFLLACSAKERVDR